MIVIFGIGFIVGIALVIALLRATMSIEPTGCILVFGTMTVLSLATLILIPWFIFGG